MRQRIAAMRQKKREQESSRGDTRSPSERVGRRRMSVRTSGDIERLRKSIDPRLISNGREQDKILRAKRRAMKLGRDAYSTPGERAKTNMC